MSRDRWSACPTLVDKEKAHARASSGDADLMNGIDD